MVITAMAEYHAGKREGVKDCGSYNYKQGLPQKKDLKKMDDACITWKVWIIHMRLKMNKK